MYDKCPTVTASAGMSGNNQPVVCLASFEGNGCRPSHQGLGISIGGGEIYTLNSTEVHGVITERRKAKRMEKPQGLDLYNQKVTGDNSASLTCNSNATSTQPTVMESEYDVRRLTPTECARLQGFPPDWCADVPHSDSAEYKLWGNGIALPSILPMMQNAVRIVKEIKNE